MSSNVPGLVNDMLGAEDGERVPNDGGDVTVEESDIWKWRDRTLYFFNQQRGLQVFSWIILIHLNVRLSFVCLLQENSYI